MVQCTRCKAFKPRDDFNKNPEKRNGLQSQCKQCQNEIRQTPEAREKHRIRNNSPEYRARREKYRLTEQGQVANARYRNSEKGKIVRGRHLQKFRKEHPEVGKAQTAIRRSVQKGIMPKANTLQCYHCNNKGELYHHYKGYAKENRLDVIPLCRKCHNIIHGFGVSSNAKAN